MLAALLAIISTVWLILLAFGAGGYVVGRVAGTIPAPAPITAGGLERLGAARLVLCGLLGLALVMAFSWVLRPTALGSAAAVAAFAGLGWACPPTVSIGRGAWALLVGGVLLIGLVAAGTFHAHDLDGVLWIAVGLGCVVWYARKAWMAAPPQGVAAATTASPAQQQPAAAPVQQSARPAAAAAMPAAVPAATWKPMGSPETIIADVDADFAGQPTAITQWKGILHQQWARFNGKSTRPAVVVHAGPTGSGRVALALDLGERLGITQPLIVNPGEDLPASPASPLVLLPADGGSRDEGLAYLVTSGARWHRVLAVVVVDADLPDTDDQTALRAALGGLVHPKLASVSTVVRFRRLDAEDLGAIAVRLLVLEGKRLGLSVVSVDHSVAAAIVNRIPSSLRDMGADALRSPMTVMLGSALDQARAVGCQRVSLHLAGEKIAAAPA